MEKRARSLQVFGSYCRAMTKATERRGAV